MPEKKPLIQMSDSGEIKIAPKLWIIMASVIVGGFVAGGSGDQVLSMIWPRQVEISSPQVEKAVERAALPIWKAVDDVNDELVEFKEIQQRKDTQTQQQFNLFANEQRRTNEKLDQLIGETRAIRREATP